MSGNLSRQIEHHLFPDIPARRYVAIPAEVWEACQRYRLPYNTGRFSKQLGSVACQLVKLALPDRKHQQADRKQQRAPLDETAVVWQAVAA